MKTRKPVKSTLVEADYLIKLKNSPEWVILKRVANRYIGHLKNVSFKLVEKDPNYFAMRHAEMTGQALGIKYLIRFIDNIGKNVEK